LFGRRVLDGPASGGQEADHGAAGIGRVGFSADQPSLLYAPDLDGGLIPVTVPELLRLLRDTVIPPPRWMSRGPSGWSATPRRAPGRHPARVIVAAAALRSSLGRWLSQV
jgi:hypothetical protein